MAINGTSVFQRMEHDLFQAVGVQDPSQAELAERLAVQLLETEVLHNATIGRGDTANLERFIWTRQLRTCIELINSAPSVRDNQLAAGLVRLLAALDDLNRGKVHPSLRPQKRSSTETGPRSGIGAMRRGHLAGILEGLIDHADMSEPEAAHWMQRRLSVAGVQVTGDQVIEWRKQARGRRKDKFMRPAYFRVQNANWSDPLVAAERLIDRYRKLC